MKKKFYALYAGILTVCLCCGNLCASAYTADDVAAKAREAGWPESLIQSGYNQWASGEYTQAHLDQAYNSVMEYNDQSAESICNILGIDPDEYQKELKEKEKPTTTQPSGQDNQHAPQPEPEVQPETPSTPQSIAQTTTQTNAQSDTDSKSTATTQTKTSGTGSSGNFISDSEFINMTMEQKQEYVNSLKPEEKTEFVAGLSTEARNSIIKQLPTEEKIAIMQKYIDVANSMGMNVTVDEITDDDISLTVRNHDGVVIDKAEVGIVIDETGISHTKPLLFAGIGILIAAAGFTGLYWYIKHTEQD